MPRSLFIDENLIQAKKATDFCRRLFFKCILLYKPAKALFKVALGRIAFEASSSLGL